MSVSNSSLSLRPRSAGRLASLLLALLAASGASLAEEIPRFAIKRFEIVGNGVLTEAELQATLRPYIGPQADFGTVQRALEALEAQYRQRGYITAQVLLPEQVLEKGSVRFKVIEGQVRRVEIERTGPATAPSRAAQAPHFSDANIRASVPALQAGQVPQVDAISAALRVANENPAKKITLHFSAAASDAAQADAGDVVARLAVAEEKPWRLGLTADNSGTPQTGQHRLGLSLQHANLWQRDHILTLQYQTAPQQPRDVNVFALAYRVPLYAWGDSVDFYASRSDVNAGNLAVGPINLAITGQGSVVGSRYQWNLKRIGAYEQHLNLGIERKRYTNGIVTGGLDLGNELTVQPLLAQYHGRWTLARGEAAFYAGLSRNLPAGAGSDATTFAQIRSGASKDYQVWRSGLAYSQVFAGDWQGRLSWSGQWSADPLVPGEQFGLGGAASVRGFREREVAGDRGHQASAEVYSPELCARLAPQRCRVVAFIDQGAAYRLQALPGEMAREHLASAGLGLRWALGKDTALQADYAQVLDAGGSQGRGDWGLHARFGLFF